MVIFFFITQTSLSRRASFRGVGPPFAICYVCARKFAPQAITAHEQSCLQKWKRQNSELPPHLRKPTPKKNEPRPVSGENYSI